jgi:hypothetical protein
MTERPEPRKNSIQLPSSCGGEKPGGKVLWARTKMGGGMGKRAVRLNKTEERVLGGLEGWWKARQSRRQSLEVATQPPQEAEAPKATGDGEGPGDGGAEEGQRPKRPGRPRAEGNGTDRIGRNCIREIVAGGKRRD